VLYSFTDIPAATGRDPGLGWAEDLVEALVAAIVVTPASIVDNFNRDKRRHAFRTEKELVAAFFADHEELGNFLPSTPPFASRCDSVLSLKPFQHVAPKPPFDKEVVELDLAIMSEPHVAARPSAANVASLCEVKSGRAASISDFELLKSFLGDSTGRTRIWLDEDHQLAFKINKKEFEDPARRRRLCRMLGFCVQTAAYGEDLSTEHLWFFSGFSRLSARVKDGKIEIYPPMPMTDGSGLGLVVAMFAIAFRRVQDGRPMQPSTDYGPNEAWEPDTADEDDENAEDDKDDEDDEDDEDD
jgi:hypothetical protein